MNTIHIMVSGAIAFLALAGASHAQVILTSSTYNQSFQKGVNGAPDIFFGLTGSSTEWVNNSSFPGWYAISEPGNGKGIRRAAPSGTITLSTNVVLYALRTTDSDGTGTDDVAIGSIRHDDNTGATAFGMQIQNKTGSTITAFNISYLLQQWQKTSVGTDGYDFAYSTNATSLTNGTWIHVSALDGNVITASENPADDKTPTSTEANTKDPGYAQTIVSSISGLSLADGQTIWFRWFDRDVTGNEAVLTIDDLSLTATLSIIPEPGMYSVVAALVCSLLALCRLCIRRGTTANRRD